MAIDSTRYSAVAKSARGFVRRSFSPATPDEPENDPPLPVSPGVIGRMWIRKSVLSEISLSAMVFFASVIESAQPLDPAADLDWTAGGWIVVNALCAAVVPLRRRAPMWVLIVFGVAGCLLIAVGRPPLISPVAVTLYSVAVYTGIGAATLGAVALYSAFLGLQIATTQLTSGNLTAPIALIIALLIGLSTGNRRKYVAAIVDQAKQLSREKDQQARLATANERSRIARELHDVVAHSLSVMIRLSDGAAAVADVDPARAGETIRLVSEVGRNSLNDMRRLLGVLREEEATDLAPQPRLDSLDELVETYRSAGLPVTIEKKGMFPAGRGVQLVIYRVVQEALTNALRYADRPTAVAVVLTAGADGVTIDVTDDGRNGLATESEGTRRGLIGLSERAAMYGGILQAGRRTGVDVQGWSVHLTLPQAMEVT